MEIKEIPIRTERGVALLRLAWEEIKAEPSAWDQTRWMAGFDLSDEVLAFIKETKRPPLDCGTAFCLAGHITMAAGATLPHLALVDAAWERGFTVSTVLDTGGQSVLIDEYAADLTGLTLRQSSWLFQSVRTARQIETFITALESFVDAGRGTRQVDPLIADRQRAVPQWEVDAAHDQAERMQHQMDGGHVSV